MWRLGGIHPVGYGLNKPLALWIQVSRLSPQKFELILFDLGRKRDRYLFYFSGCIDWQLSQIT